MRSLSSISGNLSILREYNKAEITDVSYLPKRFDTVSIDVKSLDCKNSNQIDTYLNYFGNILRYKKEPVLETDWNNVKDLYKIIEKLSFLNSGVLDTGSYDSYLEEGYLLNYCPGCVQRISLALPNDELDTLFFSGDISIEYNSFKILKNPDKLLSHQISTGDLFEEDFINFKISDSNIFKYKKELVSTSKAGSQNINMGTVPNIATSFVKEKPFFWDEITLNPKFITAISEDRSINNNFSGQINKSIFSGKAISGYEVVPNALDKYEKIQGHTVLSNIDFLPIHEYSRELYLSLYSGIEAFQYEVSEEDAMPKVKKVYDFEDNLFKFRANKYKNTQKNNFYKPAPYEKHIVLFDINLYGFSGENPEECDAEVNAYILDEGEFIDTIKNPVPLKIKVKDLKNYVTGKIEKYTDIIKEKDLITGFRLKTNVSYDASFYKNDKKYPYDLIKMEINVAAPARYCQSVPQFYLLKDENLTNFNRLRSYGLYVYNKKDSKLITSGIFISGIQTGFLVALKPGTYDFVLSGTEKLFFEETASGIIDNNLNPYNPPVPNYEFYICQPVFANIINNNKIYNSNFIAESKSFTISGRHNLTADKDASYYEYKINDKIYRSSNLKLDHTGTLNKTYKVSMRSVCSNCQPMELYIKNNNTLYNEMAGLITTPATHIQISGKPLGEAIYPCTKYEISINDKVYMSKSPTFNFFGESGSYYKIKMRGVCDFNL